MSNNSAANNLAKEIFYGRSPLRSDQAEIEPAGRSLEATLYGALAKSGVARVDFNYEGEGASALFSHVALWDGAGATVDSDRRTPLGLPVAPEIEELTFQMLQRALVKRSPEGRYVGALTINVEAERMTFSHQVFLDGEWHHRPYTIQH